MSENRPSRTPLPGSLDRWIAVPRTRTENLFARISRLTYPFCAGVFICPYPWCAAAQAPEEAL